MPAITQRTADERTAHRPRPGLLRHVLRWVQPRPPAATGGLSFRYLARQIDIDLPLNGRGRTILVSSPAPLGLSNEANLMFAHCLATELGRRVLMVDGTFSDRGVGSALGHAGAPGLLDVVCEQGFSLAQLVQPTACENVWLLPAGRTAVPHTLPIEATRIAAFYAEACGRYDYVLLQQGAIYAESRYLQFARQADMVLVLVDEGVTPVDVLNRCTTVFRDHQVPNVRLIVSVPQ